MVLTVPEGEFGWSFSLCCTYLKRILQIYPIYTDEQHKKKAKREKMIIDQKVSKQRATEIYVYMYLNFESYRQL